MLNLHAIDHIPLIVADLNATRAFYVEKLGMKQVPRPEFDFDGLWFSAGETQIHATLESPESGKAGLADQGNTIASRGHHFAFSVDDCYKEAEKLSTLGIDVIQGPKQRPDGAVQVYFFDPDGHTVELVSG